MVQWLELLASTAMGVASIPDQGTKIRHATWHGQNRNKSDTEQRVNILTVQVATRKMERREQAVEEKTWGEKEETAWLLCTPDLSLSSMSGMKLLSKSFSICFIF